MRKNGFYYFLNITSSRANFAFAFKQVPGVNHRKYFYPMVNTAHNHNWKAWYDDTAGFK